VLTWKIASLPKGNSRHWKIHFYDQHEVHNGTNLNLAFSEATVTALNFIFIGWWWYSTRNLCSSAMTRQWISCKANFRPGHMGAPDPNEPTVENFALLLCCWSSHLSGSNISGLSRKRGSRLLIKFEEFTIIVPKKIECQVATQASKHKFHLLFSFHIMFLSERSKKQISRMKVISCSESVYFSYFSRRFFSFQHKKNFSQQLWNLENKECRLQ